MGSIGFQNDDDRFPKLPEKIRYSKSSDDRWKVEDAKFEKFSPEASTAYSIVRVYSGGYRGRGTGSTTATYMVVRGTYENLTTHTFGTLKEAKNYFESEDWRK